MSRCNLNLSCLIAATLMLTAAEVPDYQFQHEMKGTLTGIETIGLRVPSQGTYRMDVRAMYFEARDFLTPRATGITIESRENQGTLEVSFEVIQLPPQREEPAGWLLISWGVFASRSDQLAERGHAGPGEAPLKEVVGLVLWQSEPEHAWFEDESELSGHVTEQIQAHLNDFLDEWFRDNVS
ncbi:hypothetical protein ACFL41_00890 [Gemmatimonadota bacterium]